MSDDTAMALAIAADQLSEAHKRIAELEAAATALVEIVDGARWGNWKALPGVRLKDMPEYVALYLAVRK